MAVPLNSQPPPAAVLVSNEELVTVREAMRELNRMVEALERGELDKVVLTQRNQIRAVLVSLDRYAELEHRTRRG
jgi:PHD/YefM family antitoxin component YafN of YafNO toxin-antitoxin module